MKVGEAVVHQLLGVRPFPGAVAGPSAGQYDCDEPPPVPFQCACIAVTGPVGETGLSCQCALHHMKKRIFIVDGEMTGAGEI